VFSSESEGEEGDNTAFDDVMDGCSTAVQSNDSKDKDFRPKARPKDPDIARAAFRA
jgi:hypothetical protein